MRGQTEDVAYLQYAKKKYSKGLCHLMRASAEKIAPTLFPALIFCEEPACREDYFMNLYGRKEGNQTAPMLRIAALHSAKIQVNLIFAAFRSVLRCLIIVTPRGFNFLVWPTCRE
jgi:hypothetical protein